MVLLVDLVGERAGVEYRPVVLGQVWLKQSRQGVTNVWLIISQRF